MLYREPVDHPTIEEITVYPLNRAELRMADAYVHDRSTAERCALERAVRSRGTAYGARVRHTTEISWRMPVLYSEALADGRMTIDHMDTIWRRLDRHPGVRAEIAEQIIRRGDRAAGDDYDDRWSGRYHGGHREPGYPLPEPENGRCSHIDQSVEQEVTDWLSDAPQRLSATDGSRTVTPFPAVTVHKLRDIVDRAADAAVEDLARLREQSLDREEDDLRREVATVEAREDAERRTRRRADRLRPTENGNIPF